MEGNFDYEEVFMGVMKTYKPEYRIRRLVETVKLKKGKMLDIGCGGGILTENLVQHYSKMELYGCDISRTAIMYARKLGSGKVKYDVLRQKKLPYKDNFFDVCICLDVMEHVPDVDFFLKEVKRVLKKNGLFFLIVPCEGQPLTFTWLFQRAKIGDQLTYKSWGHIHPEFTHKSVKKLLTDKGFSIQKTTYSEHVLWQTLNVFMYFLPKQILEYALGKKAAKYSDSGVIRSKDKNKRKNDLFMLARNMCLGANTFLRNLTHWETNVLKNTSITAWKIHLLAKNNKL